MEGWYFPEAIKQWTIKQFFWIWRLTKLVSSSLLIFLYYLKNRIPPLFPKAQQKQIPYAPYLARQFSKPHWQLRFKPRELKLGSNIAEWLTIKCINFQRHISARKDAINFCVKVLKKCCAQQYNGKNTIFSTCTTSNYYWAVNIQILESYITLVCNQCMM